MLVAWADVLTGRHTGKAALESSDLMKGMDIGFMEKSEFGERW